MQIYSNGLYESTLHQVINSSPKYRVCVAYFYEVCNDIGLFIHFIDIYSMLFSSSLPGFHHSQYLNLLHLLLLHEQTNFDTAVEPLDICKQKTGGTKKFERAVYGEHLVSKVQTNFVY